MKSGGGFKAIRYSLKASQRVGFLKMFKASFSKNTCKPCALGMGGQRGGMTDEAGHFPEVCKKSFQAQITDIQKPIPKNLFSSKTIEDFKNTSPRLLEQSGRLNDPLYKSTGSEYYTPISWDEALDKIADKLKLTDPQRSFFYSSGRSSNEAGFLLQLFARIFGTSNINNCSYYCHQASGVGITSTLGSGTATIQLKDLENADLIFVIGANPASNHPRYMRQLLNCRRRGGNVIIINPIRETGLIKFAIPSDFKSLFGGGSKIATECLQIKIGGDIALLKGIAKEIIENGNYDKDFITKYTNRSQEYILDIQNTSWDKIVFHSGVSVEKIKHIAKIYSESQNTIFSWAMGITHHLHGSDNVESIVNLALLRGMVGKPNAGLLPLRGHSNIQGIGSVGVTPVLKGVFANNINSYFGIQIPNNPGMDTISCLKSASENNIDLAFILGGNLYKASPDTNFTEKALNSVSFKVYLNTTLNHGHFTGVDQEAIILPVTARDEENHKTTQESMFNFVRISDGGINRLDNVRSEVEIIIDIANKVLGKKSINFESFKNHNILWDAIGNTVPGYENFKTPGKSYEEFQISGRTYHKPVFSTKDQKANFKVCPIPEQNSNSDKFSMMTVRSEGQFNSIIYEEEDLYRCQNNRWVVLMNKNDMKNNGFKNNDLVDLKSSVGKMECLRVKEFDITEGNIMTYYPESNVLVPATVDPRSKTPSYKKVSVNIVLSTKK
jgi:molybdopterin-dependent oxidoreductase alpha subunit